MCIKVLLEEPNHKLASWMLRMLPEGDTGPDVLLSVLRTMDANPEMGATLPVYDPKAARPSLIPSCALISHAQGSSGVVDKMLFAWRGHTKRLATRARPGPDPAMWLE